MSIGVYYPTKNGLPVIVMEKMQHSLRNLVEKHKSIIWENKLSILYDVCCGLQYLHTRNPPIIHRDLTPNNILLCSHFRAKITDLGVSKVLHTTNAKTLTQNPGTNDFMPPETLASKPVYGLPLDMFSFGGVVLYVCTQQWPQLPPWVDFDHDTGDRIVLKETERRQLYLDEMVGVYQDFKSLVISCLDDNPKNRPLVAEALLEIKQVKQTYNENMYTTITEENLSVKKEITYPLYVGRYEYSARTVKDLSFKKEDLLYILNTDDEDWWFARAKHLGQEGYIPSNYVGEYNTLDGEP